MLQTGDAASARLEEMLSTRLETGDNCRVKHNQRKCHCPAIIQSLGWVLVTGGEVEIDAVTRQETI